MNDETKPTPALGEVEALWKRRNALRDLYGEWRRVPGAQFVALLNDALALADRLVAARQGEAPGREAIAQQARFAAPGIADDTSLAIADRVLVLFAEPRAPRGDTKGIPVKHEPVGLDPEKFRTEGYVSTWCSCGEPWPCAYAAESGEVADRGRDARQEHPAPSSRAALEEPEAVREARGHTCFDHANATYCTVSTEQAANLAARDAALYEAGEKLAAHAAELAEARASVEVWREQADARAKKCHAYGTMLAEAREERRRAENLARVFGDKIEAQGADLAGLRDELAAVWGERDAERGWRIKASQALSDRMVEHRLDEWQQRSDEQASRIETLEADLAGLRCVEERAQSDKLAEPIFDAMAECGLSPVEEHADAIAEAVAKWIAGGKKKGNG